MKDVYNTILKCDLKVDWRTLMYGNKARPRAYFILWMSYHDKLSSKDKLYRFGMIDNVKCCLCAGDESLDHLFIYFIAPP